MQTFRRPGRPKFFGIFLSMVLALLVTMVGMPNSSASGLSNPSRGRTGHQPVSEGSQTAFGQVMFIENVGQFADEVRFQVRGADSSLWLAENAIWITTHEPLESPNGLPPGVNQRAAVHLKLSFPGANPQPTLEPLDRLDTRVSFFSGDESSGWYVDAPAWAGVRYADLYPGVDLVFGGQAGQWFWRLECRSNCESALQGLRLRLEGADEAEADSGALRLQTAVGQRVLPMPALAGYSLPLPEMTVTPVGERAFDVVAPVSAAPTAPGRNYQQVNLIYSGFVGGSEWDEARDNAVDSFGNAYVTGGTWSGNFPTVAGPDPNHNGSSDAFVVKVNPAGTALVYAGYLGGTLYDYGTSISVDAGGNAYVTGETWSANYPTQTGPDLTYNGGVDAFVTKLNPAGNGLVFSGFLGGGNEELGTGVAPDSNGNAYVTGRTQSTDFPTTVGPYLTYNGGYYDAFVTKVAANGAALLYSGFLGGTAWEEATDIALDANDNAYVTGGTGSSDFPVLVGPGLTYGGSADAFVTKVNAAGTALVYSGLLGGAGWDEGHGIAVDGNANAYVTGETNSAGFQVTNVPLGPAGGIDAFVTKVDGPGSGLVYSRLMGGTLDDVGYGIAVDDVNNTYLTGKTASADFPVVLGPFLIYGGGLNDAFVTKLNATGTGQVYSGFLGGTYDDWGAGISVDAAQDAYMAGGTNSSNFPTVVGPDLSQNGGVDGWVAKLDLTEPTAVTLNDLTVEPGGKAGPWLPWLVALTALLLAALAVARRRPTRQEQ